jgi:molybdopterin-guanine dinucleotide biosynthesis protein A
MAHESSSRSQEADHRAAVVLAGGYSTRFGEQDKALARLQGEPLVRRVVEHVAPAVGEVIVNCRDEQRDALKRALSGVEHRIAIDPVADRGPVAGIRTGCRTTSATWTFVTACDMPFVDSRLACRLFEAVDDDSADAIETSDDTVDLEGAVVRIDDRPQPLAAVYHTAAVEEAARTALDRGSGAVTDMLDHLSVGSVDEPVPARAVVDIDTRADLRAVQSR